MCGSSREGLGIRDGYPEAQDPNCCGRIFEHPINQFYQHDLYNNTWSTNNHILIKQLKKSIWKNSAA